MNLEQYLSSTENFENLQQQLHQSALEYSKSLEGLTQDQLIEKEKELMELFNENDAHVESLTYELSKEEGKKIASKIVHFLNKMEVEYKMALAVLQGIKFWTNEFDGSKVPHIMFDSTIRLLNMLKFKGQEEMESIVNINDWFFKAHDQYNKTLLYTHYLSQKHQEILQRLYPNQQPLHS